MDSPTKFLLLAATFMALVCAPELLLPTAAAEGECGRIPADRMAFRLASCAAATQDVNAPVSEGCCAEVKALGQKPSCLCAVMLSNLARSAGVQPEVAITIPKRCNIANRPVGYKCGDYSLP